MSEYVCCKCFNEFDDSLGECPVCDFHVCDGDCVKCKTNESEVLYQMAVAMESLKPFVRSKK